MDLGGGLKPPGFYVQRSCGLFPAPFPQDSEELERITKLFHFLGIFLAKCIQDNRLVDLPLSQPFFKLLCMGDIKSNWSKQLYQSCSFTPGQEPERLHLQPFLLLSESEASTEESQETYSVGSFDEDSKSEFIMDPPKPKPPAWYHGLLTWDDFQLVNPHRCGSATGSGSHTCCFLPCVFGPRSLHPLILFLLLQSQLPEGAEGVGNEEEADPVQ